MTILPEEFIPEDFKTARVKSVAGALHRGGLADGRGGGEFAVVGDKDGYRQPDMADSASHDGFGQCDGQAGCGSQAGRRGQTSRAGQGVAAGAVPRGIAASARPLA